MKILMVCLGNICRSPLAEGILQHKATHYQLPLKVDSAGTSDYHIGEAPHHLSQQVAKENGIDIGKQQCRQFQKSDFQEFDKIFVMDKANYKEVKRLAGEAFDEKKIDFLLNALYPYENREVPDPWYGGYEDFKKVYHLINNACSAIVQHQLMAQQQQQ